MLSLLLKKIVNVGHLYFWEKCCLKVWKWVFLPADELGNGAKVVAHVESVDVTDAGQSQVEL